jgi:predicted neuraminidase
LPAGGRGVILRTLKSKRFFLLPAVLACLAGALSPGPRTWSPSDGPILRTEYVFPPETPPSPACHASTIVELPGGELAAAWFGGTAEGRPDVGIWFARRRAAGWTRPVEIADGRSGPAERQPCWNPVLVRVPSGRLLLFYKVGPGPAAWRGMMKTSPDGGNSWSEPQPLPAGIFGPIKNKPLPLGDGRLLCGSSTEDEGWRVHMEWTDDEGRTWTRTGALNDGRTIGAIQPSLLLHPGGLLQALGRSRQGRLWTAWSVDGGRTWSPMALTALPNPNSGTDAVSLRDGRHVLVYNPVAQGRTPLVAALSADGRSWTTVAVLAEGEGEFSYPAVIQTEDGRLHVVFTWKRRAIKHVVLDPERFRIE